MLTLFSGHSVSCDGKGYESMILRTICQFSVGSGRRRRIYSVELEAGELRTVRVRALRESENQ